MPCNSFDELWTPTLGWGCEHVMVAVWAFYGLICISGLWGLELGEGRRVVFCFVLLLFVCLLALNGTASLFPQGRKVHYCTAPSQFKASSFSWQNPLCANSCGIIRKKMAVLGVSSKVLAHSTVFWSFMLLYPSVLPPRLPGFQMHPGLCILMQ